MKLKQNKTNEIKSNSIQDNYIIKAFYDMYSLVINRLSS